MEGENTWSVKVLDWDDEQVPEPHMCTGCVVEFTFGPAKHSYLATSYPYRAEYAEGDKHKIAQFVIPTATSLCSIVTCILYLQTGNTTIRA